MHSSVRIILEKHDNELLSNRLNVKPEGLREEVEHIVELMNEEDRFWYLARILIGSYSRRSSFRIPGKARITPVALLCQHRSDLFEDLTECSFVEIRDSEEHRYAYYLG